MAVPEGVAGTRPDPERPALPGALPRIDGRPAPTDLADAPPGDGRVRAPPAVRPPAPRVRLLPAVPAARPRAAGPTRRPVAPWARREHPRAGVADFDANPHLVVIGDTETGKTNLLRHIARAIATHYRSDDARIVFGDFRRQLYDAVPRSHQVGSRSAPTRSPRPSRRSPDICANACPAPTSRPNVCRCATGGPVAGCSSSSTTSSSPRARATHPCSPWCPSSPRHQDIGLHVIIARRTAGASRAFMNQAIRRIWELGNPACSSPAP